MKRLILSIAMLILSASLFSQGRESVVYQYYQQGIKAYESKDYKTFLECFERIEKISPNSPKILYNLACAYSLNGNKEKAISTLRRLILIDVNPSIEVDSDFNSIQTSSEFKALVNEMRKIRKPIGRSREAFSIDNKPGYHLESIAFDDETKTYYFGSIRKRKILKMDENGELDDFSDSNEKTVWSVLGMHIDKPRGVLWATTAALDQMEDAMKKELGKTALIKFDLKTGKMIKRYVLPSDQDKNLFGDVIISAKGDVYTTDTYSARVYVIRTETDRLEIFAEHRDFTSLNGLALNEEQNILYVADYRTGLYAVDAKRGRILTKLSAPEKFPPYGIDGLYFYNNSLISIHNGIKPNRLTRYFLEEDGKAIRKAKVLERANPKFGEPTLGTVVGNKLYYIANSEWNAYNRNYDLEKAKSPEKVVILKLKLRH